MAPVSGARAETVALASAAPEPSLMAPLTDADGGWVHPGPGRDRTINSEYKPRRIDLHPIETSPFGSDAVLRSEERTTGYAPFTRREPAKAALQFFFANIAWRRCSSGPRSR